MFSQFTQFVRTLYQSDDFIPLHAPIFSGNEKQYLTDAIESTFVSSVSNYVEQFERMIRDQTGAKFVVATMNGTAALHIALHSLGVKANEEVITQAFSFIGTVNAISYCGASPLFIDISPESLGLDSDALEKFLDASAVQKNDGTYNKHSGKKISACVPMHTFGHPLDIEGIISICQQWNIPVVEDAAEALGSFRGKRHCGTFGNCGVLSFNGNKVVTTGGGGAVISDDEILSNRIRHLTTTAKVKHRWEFQHDEIGFNYRMPGINAALGCAQFESLPGYLTDKRQVAKAYQDWAAETGVNFVKEPTNTHSNYWLNAFELESKQQRDEFLTFTNDAGVMTRPPWNLLCDLPMYKNAICGNSLPVSREKVDRLVNIPSSMRSL